MRQSEQQQDTPIKKASHQQSSSTRVWEALTPALSQWILEYVASMGFARMTPVQANAIPLFLGNKDVVVEAVTGSGKTLAFLLPIVEKLLRLSEPVRKHHVGAIIVSPTRELASQIYSVLLSLLAFHPPSAAHLHPPDEGAPDNESDTETPPAPTYPDSTLKVIPQLVVGGTGPATQDLAYFLNNSPNLLVATPGRLLELLSSKHVHCPQSSFEVLVLDEADRLLDMGFKEDLQNILKRLPKQRRTGLFSASISDAVDQLVRVGLRNPVRIAVKVRGPNGVEDKKTPASLQMSYISTPATHKLPALSRLLRHLDPTPQKIIVYLSTCAAVDYFSALLPSFLSSQSNPLTQFTVIPLHGKQTPQHRNKNYTLFTTSPNLCVLLTTDLASRGLDISGVDLTVQLDPPSDPKTFLHRAGRAGRAGRRGLAIVMLLPGRETEEYPAFLQVRKTPITLLDQPEITTTTASEADRCTKQLRKQVLTDRTLHEKGQRAFVSWVRSYSKHEARSIFRISDLPWKELGNAWGLLRLPKMPELGPRSKHTSLPRSEQNHALDTSDTAGSTESEAVAAAAAAASTVDDRRDLGVDMDWDAYSYKDKQKEQKRISAADAAAASNRTASGPTSTSARPSQKPWKRPAIAAAVAAAGGEGAVRGAWSQKSAQQMLTQHRRSKKLVKREATRAAKLTDAEKAHEATTRDMLTRVRQMYAASAASNHVPKTASGTGTAAAGPDSEWNGFD